MKILAVKRDERFSLDAAEKDLQILSEVARLMGSDVTFVAEKDIDSAPEADVYLSMARLPQTIERLKAIQQAGALVVNSPESVEMCTRNQIDQVMRDACVPMPPLEGKHGYWLKRGDAQAHSADDLVYCNTEEELDEARRRLSEKGVETTVVSAHVEGSLVKFYCAGNAYFRYFYVDDDIPHHAFDEQKLRDAAHSVAQRIGIDIYGGDCIVTSDGSFYIIDFNDWPSFHLCHEEAASEIAKVIKGKIKSREQDKCVDQAPLAPTEDHQKQESFSELLKSTMKSKDTEETIDVWFTRPVGLVFALMWRKLGVHPNVVTILSIFLGIAAAVMFSHTDLRHNLIGVALLVTANLCDSTDGQLARMTGKKSFIGRMLDGFSGDIWFFSIYVALSVRLMQQFIPGTHTTWGIWIWLLAIASGTLCHFRQSSLADYYRQIHLFFLKGREGSELDTYAQQKAYYESLPKNDWLKRLFYFNYVNYCKSQEDRTPEFQRFMKAFLDSGQPAQTRTSFLEKSRKLMPETNFLSFNARAICLYLTCLLDCPWMYLILEMTLFQAVYFYMRHTHETMSRQFAEKL